MNYGKSAIGYKEFAAFQQLLVADTARGLDGTGVIKVLDTGKASFRKIASDPFELFRHKRAKEFFGNAVAKEFTRFLVGHNRYATKGGVSTETAHPFAHGDIILVHNGTVSGGNLPELKEFQVDSEAICAAISRRGLEDTLAQFTGPYCLVWYDIKQKTLNMTRNFGRPMYIAECKSQDTILFGSEKSLLMWIADRHNYYVTTHELPTYTHLEWHVDDEKPRIRKLPITTHSYYNTSPAWDGFVDSGTTSNCEFDNTSGQWIPQASQNKPVDMRPPATLSAKVESPVFPVKAPSPTLLARLDKWTERGEIEFNIHNWETLPADNRGVERIAVEGGVDTFPNLLIKMTLRSNKILDALVQGHHVKASIASIQRPTEQPREGIDYVIWAILPQAVSLISESPTQIVTTPTQESGEALSPKDKEETAALLKQCGVSVIH